MVVSLCMVVILDPPPSAPVLASLLRGQGKWVMLLWLPVLQGLLCPVFLEPYRTGPAEGLISLADQGQPQ